MSIVPRATRVGDLPAGAEFSVEDIPMRVTCAKPLVARETGSHRIVVRPVVAVAIGTVLLGRKFVLSRARNVLTCEGDN